MALPLVFWNSRTRVNSTDQGSNFDDQFKAQIIAHNDGYVVVWRDNSDSSNASFSQIKFQRYDYRGLKIGDEVTAAGGFTSNTPDKVAVTALPGSGFAIAVGNDERGVVPYRMGGGAAHARAFSGD